MVSKYTAIQQGRSAIEAYHSQIGELRTEENKIDKGITVLENQIQKAINDLVVGFNVSDSVEVIVNINNLIGCNLRPLIYNLTQINSERITKLNTISNDSDFINSYNLFDPTTGSVKLEINDINQQLSVLTALQKQFQNDSEFQQLYKARNQEVGKLTQLFRNLSGEKALIAKVIARYTTSINELSDLSALFAMFFQVNEDINMYQGNLNALSSRVYNNTKLKKDYQELEVAIAGFEVNLITSLEAELSSFILRSESLLELRNNFTGIPKTLVTTIIALKQKLAVALKTQSTLNAEIRSIETVKTKINNVVGKWNRSKNSTINGDKSKWLVKGPANRAKRTKRYVSSSRTVYSSTYLYNDYDNYGTFLDTNPSLPFWYMAMESNNDRVPASFMQDLVPDYDQFDASQFDLGNDDVEVQEDLDLDIDTSEAMDDLADDIDSDDDNDSDDSDNDSSYESGDESMSDDS